MLSCSFLWKKPIHGFQSRDFFVVAAILRTQPLRGSPQWKLMMSHTKLAHLTTDEKQRYFNKIDNFNFDPYLLTTKLLTPRKHSKNLPNLTFADIYIYLVHNPSPYTGEALNRAPKCHALNVTVTHFGLLSRPPAKHCISHAEKKYL